MPGKMGRMMERAGFRMNGRTKIYTVNSNSIDTEYPEAYGAEVSINPHKLIKTPRFYGNDLLKGKRLFRYFILKPDTKAGARDYEANHLYPVTVCRNK